MVPDHAERIRIPARCKIQRDGFTDLLSRRNLDGLRSRLDMERFARVPGRLNHALQEPIILTPDRVIFIPIFHDPTQFICTNQPGIRAIPHVRLLCSHMMV